MQHRDGKKFRGNHTTYIDLAADVVDILSKLKEVGGISAGFIRSDKSVAGGTRRVKIGDMLGGILLTVRQSRSVQEVRVFSKDAHTVKLALAKKLRDRDVPIAFKRQ